jgi:23S rRNA pseudouridine1911/1915/1917 synthase
LARSQRATRKLCDQFARRTVDKEYWALVEGQVQPEAGTWQDWMWKIPGQALAAILPPDHPQARVAILHYVVRAFHDGITWLQIRLDTGRTHQIRLQAATRGCPILGDQLYGATRLFGPSADDPRDRWIALHARRIEFWHAQAAARLSVTAPLPHWWHEHVRWPLDDDGP